MREYDEEANRRKNWPNRSGWEMRKKEGGKGERFSHIRCGCSWMKRFEGSVDDRRLE